MKIAVIGTGYVGLVTGTCLAEIGNQVTCIDIDKAKIKRLRQMQLPIYEPRLGVLLNENIESSRLSFNTNLEEGITGAEVIFLVLPTPQAQDGSTDLSFVLKVAGQLGPLLKKYCIIVNKSTVPVGTAQQVRKIINKSAKTPFDVVSNPEFLREGLAVDDFMKPDRIIVGTSSARAGRIMAELYQPFSAEGTQLMIIDEASAEMTKYAANAYLATKISFMNEIANMCELIGADVDAVRLGIGSDSRIGQQFLFPGIGYGGSCFPKDVLALKTVALHSGYDFKILHAVDSVNSSQKKLLVRKIKKYYGNKLARKTFALWGLAFKPDTDDIREAPALEIIDELLRAGAQVKAYDPEAADNVKKLYHGQKQLTFASDQYDALVDADALLIATEWHFFKSPDFERMKKNLKSAVIFDGRNLYNPNEMMKHKFYYESVGRQTVKSP